MYNAVLISSVQSDSDCFPFFFRFFPIIGFYKIMVPVLNKQEVVLYFTYGSAYLFIPDSSFIPLSSCPLQ